MLFTLLSVSDVCSVLIVLKPDAAVSMMMVVFVSQLLAISQEW